MLCLWLSCFVQVSPPNPNYSYTICVSFFVAAAGGFVDNVAQAIILRRLKDRVGPYLQSLHACFGIGALLGPLILSFYVPSVTEYQDLHFHGILFDGSIIRTVRALHPDKLITLIVLQWGLHSTVDEHVQRRPCRSARLGLWPLSQSLFYRLLHRLGGCSE